MSKRTRSTSQTATTQATTQDEAALLAAEVAEAKAQAQAAIDAEQAAKDAPPAPAPAPAPSAVNALRGKSSVGGPVAFVRQTATAMLAASGQPLDHADNANLRSRVVAACKAAGIAHYTARTQYQVWYKATKSAPAPLTPEEKLVAAQARLAAAQAELDALAAV